MADVLEKFQTIRTPAGEELVVMTRAEFDRLAALAAEAEAEEADDIAIYDARKAEYEASGREVLPAEVSALILKGASVLTAIRKWRGMTQKDLAAKAGLGQSYVSSLENRERKGSDDVWAAIAKALDVPPAWIRPAS